MSKFQTLKGFRDFLPEQMRVRNFVLQTLQEVFGSFGFEPLKTPSLEYSAILLGKCGAEAEKLVYTFQDRGNRDVGLIYDLTVPIARVLATYQDKIKLPFKRYQIQRVWRAEKPQKGRYREILQCDVDTFGVASPLADAEIIAVIYTALKKLGFEKFTIKINSRQVLAEQLEKAGIPENRQATVLQTLDKLDKAGDSAVKEELLKKGFSEDQVKSVISCWTTAQPDRNLKTLFSMLEQLGVDKDYYKFTPTLVRGLDYYTGTIFETQLLDTKGSSITGGGRYDNLIEQLGGPSTPAIGTSFGLDRICDAITELELLKESQKPATEVLVTIFEPSLQEKSLKLAGQLRREGIGVEIYLNPEAKLDKQFKYADRKGIPYVAILGPEEIKEGQVTLKNMATGEQDRLTSEELISKLKN